MTTSTGERYRPLFDPDAGPDGQPFDAHRAYRLGDRSPSTALPYVYDERITLAVNTALAAGRPLLVRGHPGTGKSSLARSVADKLGWRFYAHTVSSARPPETCCGRSTRSRASPTPRRCPAASYRHASATSCPGRSGGPSTRRRPATTEPTPPPPTRTPTAPSSSLTRSTRRTPTSPTTCSCRWGATSSASRTRPPSSLSTRRSSSSRRTRSASSRARSCAAA